MKKIELADTRPREGLTRDIQAFWTRNVNAERIMGRAVSESARGDAGYFADLEAQRFRSHRHLKPWIETMVPGRSVLEVGCGIGLDSFAIAGHGVDLTAVNLTEAGVATASGRFRREGVAGRFAVSDACELPFTDGAFDYVYSFGVLHHVADTQRAIDEVFRVLIPGGQALVMLYNRRSVNEYAHRLSRVPFEDRAELCPVVRRFSIAEAKCIFRAFARTEIHLDYVFGRLRVPVPVDTGRAIPIPFPAFRLAHDDKGDKVDSTSTYADLTERPIPSPRRAC